MIRAKASLHLHTHEDGEDAQQISYSIYDLINEAARLGFGVLALTGHKTYICRQEYISYAEAKGILLLPGIEAELRERAEGPLAGAGKHCLIINCGPDAEKIKTMADLKAYRASHPEALVILAHPNHGFGVSLGLKKMEKYRELFDAVEHSWFYTKLINPNRAAERSCRRLDLPFIATADLHQLQFFAGDYAELELEDLSPQAVKAAVVAGRFRNFTSPKSLWQLISTNAAMLLRSLIKKLSAKKPG